MDGWFSPPHARQWWRRRYCGPSLASIVRPNERLQPSQRFVDLSGLNGALDVLWCVDMKLFHCASSGLCSVSSGER